MIDSRLAESVADNHVKVQFRRYVEGLFQGSDRLEQVRMIEQEMEGVRIAGEAEKGIARRGAFDSVEHLSHEFKITGPESIQATLRHDTHNYIRRLGI